MEKSRFFNIFSLAVLLFLLFPKMSVSAQTTLRIGVYQNRPLVFFNQKTGEAEGIYVDLLKSIAKKEGWHLTYIPGSWPQCLKRLSSGEIDLLPAIAYSKQRTRKYDFNTETIVSDWAVLYAPITSDIDSIPNLKGKTIAVLKGDIYYTEFKSLIARFNIHCHFLEVNSYSAIVAALINGRADAGLIDRMYTVSFKDLFKIRQTPIVCCPVELRFATARGRNTAVLAAIDRDIKAYKSNPDSPYYQALSQWHFNRENTTIPDWVVWLGVALAGLLLVLFVLNTILNIRLRRKTRQLTLEARRHKKTMQTAIAREKYMQKIFDTMNDYLYFHDLDGKFIEFNAPASDRTGYSNEKPIALEIRTLVPEQYRKEVDVYLERVRRNGTDRGYMRIQSANGQQRVIEYNNTMVYNDEGAPIGVQGIARDITDQILARKALKESEKKYRTILDSIEDAYYEVDLAGDMLFFNDSMLRILGYSREELTGMNYRQYVDAEDTKAIFEAFNYVVHTGKAVKAFNWKLIRKDGSFCHVETSVSLNIDKNGKPVGFRGIARDISERFEAERNRKELEAQLQQAQKMESIGTLAGGIAHDFNNILFPLIGYTEMAIEDTPEGSTARDHLDKVIQSAERARALVQQILTFSRQSTNDAPAPANVQPVIKETLKLLRNTIPASINIHSHIDDTAGKVIMHPNQIHQVMMNLCTNAFQAMEDQEKGTLSVTLEQIAITPDSSAKYENLTPGPYLNIAVSDTGDGISPEIRDKIFEPYFTTKAQNKGTGLGLSVSYGIIKNAGGIICVDSTPGRGTRFDIYLPMVMDSEPTSEIRTFSGPLPKGNERILLVDDEQQIVELQKHMLESLGYLVTPRTSSVEAFEAFRFQPDRFDLIVTDQAMPNMTGTELVRAVLGIRPQMPIIICTGYSEKITSEKIKALGIKAFLLKPIPRNAMALTVRKVLDEAEEKDENR